MTFRDSHLAVNCRVKALVTLIVTWLGIQVFITVTLPPYQQSIVGMFTVVLLFVMAFILLLVMRFFHTWSTAKHAQRAAITGRIDYNNLLLYVVLGILLAVFSTTTILCIYSFDWLHNFLGPALFFISIAIFIFFIGMRPIATYYGPKVSAIDFVIACILFAIIIAFVAL